MKLRGRNLSIGMQGDDVRLLHTELRQLGLAVRDDELREARFGESTRDAVSRLQEKNGLRPDGEVDERTAQVINALVDALPPTLPADDPPQPFIVHGQVLYADQKPATGVQVVAFDRDVAGEDRLGSSITDAEGAYR